ncbi:MAG: hypothetical protein ACHP84_20720 [Caulobacterales bacterium]
MQRLKPAHFELLVDIVRSPQGVARPDGDGVMSRDLESLGLISASPQDGGADILFVTAVGRELVVVLLERLWEHRRARAAARDRSGDGA